MKPAFTIHEIGLAKERIAPNSVISLDEKTYAELESLGAIRAATKEEVAIAGLSEASVKPVVAPAQKKAAVAAKKPSKQEIAEAAAKKAETETSLATGKKSIDPDDLLGDN